MQSSLFGPDVLLALGITVGAGLATVLGSLLVVFTDRTQTRVLAFGLAFAAGAMVYVSLVEIFVKSQTAFGAAMPDKQAYAYATLWFFVGALALIAVDRLVPNPHAGMDSSAAGGTSLDRASAEANQEAMLRRVGLLAALAITAHNLPEGLATFFATLDDPVVGLPLAIAIAVHNIPEGVSIAVPVFYATGSRQKAVLAALLSGLAEPVGALVGYLLLAPFMSDLLFGGVFGVIAGAMVFLALDELLPAARLYARGHETVYGMVIGMGAIATSLVLFR
ncbi:zinc transporter ZupT [Mesorhizobium sp. RP14(2022)]|uniref:Zinc transporter ZupT n=1 Tax=Mesorhizobium liriopis TaxID=2953882 RepID=A0ABT1C1Z9_9HYPH|nr:zinc transporter ZupT [Mesorhizobium liriopis]